MAEIHEHYRGFNIFVEQDEGGGDGPRDWDNLGTMVCFHSRHILGDTGGTRRKLQKGIPHFPTPDAFEEWAKDKPMLLIDLILAEHGNIWMSTRRDRYPFNCPWDSGQVGWIYVTYEDVAKEYSCPDGLATTEALDRARCCLLGEVEAYNQFISGDVYSYTVKHPSGEWLDGCGGYYGHDFETNGLLENAHRWVDWHLAKAYKDRARQVMAWIREGVPHIYRTPMRI